MRAIIRCTCLASTRRHWRAWVLRCPSLPRSILPCGSWVMWAGSRNGGLAATCSAPWARAVRLTTPGWPRLRLAACTPASMTVQGPVLIPATVWQMGSKPDGGFAFDNEKAAHAVSVPEFEIDAQPVTWAQFVEFVDDGGYDRQELWQAEGWQWL